MEFRIKQESDGWYYAEYKAALCWWYVPGSISKNIKETEEACEYFKNNFLKKDKIIKRFNL